VAAAGLLLAVLLAAWLASHLTGPIRRLEIAASQIAAGRFPAQPGAEGPAEVRSLARSLGHMTARLSQLDSQRRAFLADVSHELRTPLAAVRGALEGIRAAAGMDAPSLQYVDTALHETARMSRLVDDLLALARAEAGRLVLQRRPVDLAEETARVALSLEPIASRRRVGFRFDLPEEPVLVDADPDRLSQVLWNLLDNAARHTPGGCEARVALAPGAEHAVLRLQNPGAVWSAEDAAGLFERFERRDTEGGAGLGLAIARTLARAHGGDLEAEPLPEGGLAVTLRWPRAAARRPADRPVGPEEGDAVQA
jgi:signal transduction histidine kinase